MCWLAYDERGKYLPKGRTSSSSLGSGEACIPSLLELALNCQNQHQLCNAIIITITTRRMITKRFTCPYSSSLENFQGPRDLQGSVSADSWPWIEYQSPPLSHHYNHHHQHYHDHRIHRSTSRYDFWIWGQFWKKLKKSQTIHFQYLHIHSAAHHLCIISLKSSSSSSSSWSSPSGCLQISLCSIQFHWQPSPCVKCVKNQNYPLFNCKSWSASVQICVPA